MGQMLEEGSDIRVGLGEAISNTPMNRCVPDESALRKIASALQPDRGKADAEDAEAEVQLRSKEEGQVVILMF